METDKHHWEQVYRTRDAEDVSWYREHLDQSLALIEATGVGKAGHIIDVGGGASTLVDDLLARGYEHLYVLDLSGAALETAQTRLGPKARGVEWWEADVTRAALPDQRFDVWHDRAVFHFLTDPESRRLYVEQVRRTVKPGGHVIVACFGPDGPLQCSGLDTRRYDAKGLHAEFGEHFRLERSLLEEHRTPHGKTQQFLYCYCRLWDSQ